MYDKVKCLECGKLFGVITSHHLKNCSDMTIEQYKEKHPGTETVSEKIKDVRRNNCKNKAGKTKTVTCNKCGKEMETSIVNHWEFICEDCRIPEVYPNKKYIKEEDLVVCQICFQGMEQISWMHLETHGLIMSEYKEMFPKALLTNKRIRKQRRERFKADKNPTKRKEVRKKMSFVHTYTAQDYINKYPWIFTKIEKIRDHLGVIEVQCKKCKKWFSPTKIQMTERIRALSYGSDGQYMYCSDECKGVCPLYRLNPLQYLTDSGEKVYTEGEYKVFREEVLRRQKYEYGDNFCEICGSKKKLQVHHEKPQKTHSIMALDPDNGIVLCDYCHLKKVHTDYCSTGNLSKIIC